MFWCIVGVVVVLVIVMIIAVRIDKNRLVVGSTEEKGPMPKNHGGFGQRVTGGKS